MESHGMSSIAFQQIPEPHLIVTSPSSITLRVGVMLVFLALVHAGITVGKKQFDGFRALVIPMKTSLLFLAGIWLVGLGIGFG